MEHDPFHCSVKEVKRLLLTPCYRRENRSSVWFTSLSDRLVTFQDSNPNVGTPNLLQKSTCPSRSFPVPLAQPYMEVCLLPTTGYLEAVRDTAHCPAPPSPCSCWLTPLETIHPALSLVPSAAPSSIQTRNQGKPYSLSLYSHLIAPHPPRALYCPRYHHASVFFVCFGLFFINKLWSIWS